MKYQVLKLSSSNDLYTCHLQKADEDVVEYHLQVKILERDGMPEFSIDFPAEMEEYFDHCLENAFPLFDMIRHSYNGTEPELPVSIGE